MPKIGLSKWNAYRKAINDIHEEYNQETIIWLRHAPAGVAMYNEEKEETYTEIELMALVGYNYFRTWPITKHKTTGNLDDQNLIVMFNIKYLTGLGYTTPDGYFDFKPEQDIFNINGIIYRADGDTQLAQASTDPLLMQVIMRREEVKTGVSKLDQ